MNSSTEHLPNRDRGVTLLIALLVVASISAIAGTMAGVAFRELQISGAVEDSIQAFYVQEAGTECARYWALRDNDAFRPSGNNDIECHLEEFVTDQDLPENEYQFSFDYLTGGSSNEPEVAIGVTRQSNAPIRDLLIDSSGYNAPTTANTRSQWFRQTKMYGLCAETPDFMMVLDESGSIGDLSVSPDSASYEPEMELIREAATDFTLRMQPKETGNNVHIGRLAFSGSHAHERTLVLRKGLNGDQAPLPELPVCRPGSDCSPANRMAYATYIAHAFASTAEMFNDDGVNDRTPDSDFPDMAILLTDGSPVYRPTTLMGTRWESYVSTSTDSDDFPREEYSVNTIDATYYAISHVDVLRITEIAANELKDKGVDIIVVVIGDPRCREYLASNGYDVEDSQRCAEWMDKVISGPSTDRDYSTRGGFYFYQIDEFNEVADVFGTISTCSIPIIDK